MQSSALPELQKDDEGDIGDEKSENVLLKTEPLEFEKGGQATQNKLPDANLGLNEEPPPTFITRNMSPEGKETYFGFIKHDQDISVW